MLGFQHEKLALKQQSYLFCHGTPPNQDGFCPLLFLRMFYFWHSSHSHVPFVLSCEIQGCVSFELFCCRFASGCWGVCTTQMLIPSSHRHSFDKHLNDSSVPDTAKCCGWRHEPWSTPSVSSEWSHGETRWSSVAAKWNNGHARRVLET